jgi:hypothetical protein
MTKRNELRYLVFRTLLVLLIGLLWFATTRISAQQVLPPRTAIVRIVPICEDRVDFKCRLEVSDFRQGETGENLASRFFYGSGSGIPYGTYRATMYFADTFVALPIVRTILVSKPDVDAVIDLRPQPRNQSTSKTQK